MSAARMSWARRATDPARMPEGPLRELARHPPPGRSCDARALPVLAVDLETTGLDPARDHILAIGMVPVDGAAITLAGAGRILVRPPQEVGASATVHGLTDDALAGADGLDAALPQLLRAMHGRALLAHHAVIERRFLTAACRRLYGAAPGWAVIDTVKLQRRVLGRRWQPPDPARLRLQPARDHFGLPRYRAHDALTDALGCAELYLAQVAALAGDDRLTLGQLLR